MLPTARENKIDIRKKLNIRTELCFDSFFRVFCNLLKLINGDIATLF